MMSKTNRHAAILTPVSSPDKKEVPPTRIPGLVGLEAVNFYNKAVSTLENEYDAEHFKDRPEDYFER